MTEGEAGLRDQELLPGGAASQQPGHGDCSTPETRGHHILLVTFFPDLTFVGHTFSF